MFEWFPVLEGIKTLLFSMPSLFVVFEWFPVLEGIKTLEIASVAIILGTFEWFPVLEGIKTRPLIAWPDK